MFICIIFLLNIISPFKHCLDLYITDSALKVSWSLYWYSTSISHGVENISLGCGVRASLMLFLALCLCYCFYRFLIYWEVIENQSYTGSLQMDMMLFFVLLALGSNFTIFFHTYTCVFLILTWQRCVLDSDWLNDEILHR